MKKLFVFFLCLVYALIATPYLHNAWAAIRNVNCEWGEGEDTDGDLDYKTIQKAIDEANNGDGIIVYPCVYNEDITISGKDIIIVSSNADDLEIIKATVLNGPKCCVSINDSNCTLKGFKITNASTATCGFFLGNNGIMISGSSSPEISNCYIVDNPTYGIRCMGQSSPKIRQCWIHNNNYGIGCFSDSNQIVIENCWIKENKMGIFASDSSPLISKCTIEYNNNDSGDGGGIYCNGSSSLVNIVNTLILGNTASGKGGGIFCNSGSMNIAYSVIGYNVATTQCGGIICLGDATSPINIINTIIWGNKEGSEENLVFSNIWGNCFNVRYSDVQVEGPPYPGEGNINQLPKWLDATGKLLPDSPCRDMGECIPIIPDDKFGNPRPQGDGCDIGLYEIPGCSIEIAPVNDSFDCSGGTGEIAVTTDPNCEWIVEEDCSWVSIHSGSSGKGSGKVIYIVAPCESGQQVNRECTLKIAGKYFTIYQGEVVCDDDSGNLDIGNDSNSIGRQIKIPVRLHNTPNIVKDFGFDIPYDSGMFEFIDYEPGSSGNKLDFPVTVVPFPPDNPTKLKIGGYSAQKFIPANENGVLCYMIFKILGGEENRCYFGKPINLVNDMKNFTTSGGCACIIHPCCGDADGDGQTTPQDAQKAFMCWATECTDCECCDADEDGDVLPNDAGCILRYWVNDPNIPSCLDEKCPRSYY